MAEKTEREMPCEIFEATASLSLALTGGGEDIWYICHGLELIIDLTTVGNLW